MTPRLVSLILAFFAAGSTVAGTLISPTAGQRLSAHKPFTVEYNSDRYFLESSIAISIVISTDKKGLNGTLPFKDHPPTNHTGRYNSATYKLEVQPPFFLRDVAVPADGKHTVYVLENYYPAYGGHTALEVTGVPVTFF
ncbi:hypothetical protein C8R46DRAFT_1227275 [Mycena filopes]|nr:hypothetical protein C8R46DRAFT_1227275 [Mycena filopes]